MRISDATRSNILFAGVSDTARFLGDSWNEFLGRDANTITYDAPTWELLNRLDLAGDEASGEDWDGYGAKPVSPVSIRRARAFIDLFPHNLELPEIFVDPHGEIWMEWQTDRRRVFAVTFPADRIIGYTGLIGSHSFRGVIGYSYEIPESIISSVNHLFGKSH